MCSAQGELTGKAAARQPSHTQLSSQAARGYAAFGFFKGARGII